MKIIQKEKRNTTMHNDFTSERGETQLKETNAWSGKKLNIRISETKGEKKTKYEITRDALLQNSKPNAVMFGMTIAFFIPILIFWMLAINTSALFWIGVAGFTLGDGVIAWITIDGEIHRHRRVRNIQNEGISLLERTCTDKKCGNCDVGDQIDFVYQLFFGDVNYRVSKMVYDQISVNDKIMFVFAKNEELPLAYPKKHWSFVD